MASVLNLPGGKRAVQFTDHQRRRRTMRLGRVTAKQADRFADRVEHLVAAARANVAIDGDTADWLADIADEFRDKLAGFGLCEPRRPNVDNPKPTEMTVGLFLASYLAMRTDVAGSTTRHLREAAAKVEEFLGTARPLASVTALDAEAYRLHLRETLGENTTRRMVSRARQFFAAAVRGEHIPKSPFSELKGLNVRSVRARQAFINRETTYKLLDAAPDAEWRAIIALARFGGLRVPSELAGLRWAHVDWTAGTMTVASPKTAHCGKASRVVPLFPELRTWLREAFDVALATNGTLPEFMLLRCRSADVNLRQGLLRIIAKAGLTAWPKLFVNLRASRATELVQHYPGHVAAEWLGHTEAIADEHYRQTTAEHYTRAAAEPTGALQGALRPTAATNRLGQPADPSANKKSPVLQGLAPCGELGQLASVPPDGLEPSTL